MEPGKRWYSTQTLTATAAAPASPLCPCCSFPFALSFWLLFSNPRPLLESPWLSRAPVAVGEGFPPPDQELSGILTLTMCLLAFRLTPLSNNTYQVRGRACWGQTNQTNRRWNTGGVSWSSQRLIMYSASYFVFSGKLLTFAETGERKGPPPCSYLETSCSELLAHRIGQDCQHPHSVEVMPCLRALTKKGRTFRGGPRSIFFVHQGSPLYQNGFSGEGGVGWVQEYAHLTSHMFLPTYFDHL